MSTKVTTEKIRTLAAEIITSITKLEDGEVEKVMLVHEIVDHIYAWLFLKNILFGKMSQHSNEEIAQRNNEILDDLRILSNEMYEKTKLNSDEELNKIIEYEIKEALSGATKEQAH